MAGDIPGLHDAQAKAILLRINALAAYGYNHVVGGTVVDGGTTQLTGVNTPPNLDLDVDRIIDCTVWGIAIEKVAVADIDSDAGDTVVWGAVSGKSFVAAVVLEQDGTYTIVPGAVADTGGQVSPTDDEINEHAAGPATSTWVRVADVTFNRTADTAITWLVDHTARPNHGGLPGNLAVTNEEFTDTGAPRVFSTTPDQPPTEP